MSDADEQVKETRINEVANRHLDLVSRMKRIDDALARRAVGAVVRAHPDLTFAQACGHEAVRLRHEIELSPPGADGHDFRRPIAFFLDQIASRYPESERFRPRFRFECAEPAAVGQGTLDATAWQFERVFADPAGRVGCIYSVETVERLAETMRVPLPAGFFRLTVTDVAMAATAVQLYCHVSGEDPTRRLEMVFRDVHPLAAERMRADAARAAADAEAAMAAGHAPTFSPS